MQFYLIAWKMAAEHLWQELMQFHDPSTILKGVIGPKWQWCVNNGRLWHACSQASTLTVISTTNNKAWARFAKGRKIWSSIERILMHALKARYEENIISWLVRRRWAEPKLNYSNYHLLDKNSSGRIDGLRQEFQKRHRSGLNGNGVWRIYGYVHVCDMHIATCT